MVLPPETVTGAIPAGEVVEFAKQIQELAPAGEVILTQETYGQVYGFFDVQGLPPMAVGNRAEPVHAYLALRARARSLARTLRSVQGVELAMVGRSPELEALKAAFRSAAERRELRMMTVLGEAGIGKSRLLREFERWLQASSSDQAILLWGRAEAEMGGQPFSLIRDVFRSRFEILDSDPASVAFEKFDRGFAELLTTQADSLRFQARVIGQLLGFDFSARQNPSAGQDAAQTRHQVFTTFGDLLSSLVPEPDTVDHGPDKKPAPAVLLVLEDIHWGDDDSLDLVAHLNQACQGSPLMILSFARPALLDRRPKWFDGKDPHTRLELGPLSRRDSKMLVQNIMCRAPQLPPAFSETILADSGGNPYYIEEIIKVLLEKQVLVPAEGTWRFDPKRLTATRLSPKLTGVLRARMDGLSEPERTVLQCASVIGHVFWDSAVVRLCGATTLPTATATSEQPGKKPTTEALAGLCRKELIYRREGSGFAGMVEFSFKHELLRDVAYESLIKRSRREHHAQVAAWLVENGGDRIKEFAGLVAVHFEQADRLAMAAEWYGRAGELARNGYAPAAAIEFFQKAIHLHASSAEAEAGERQRRQWYEGLSDALTTQGRFAESLASYSKARSLAEASGDIAVQVRAWNGLAYLHERQGDNRASIEAAERAESLIRQTGETCGDELIRALDLKGWASYRMGNAPAVLALAAQTLELCEQSGNRIRMISSFKLFGVANLQLGRYPEADRYFQRGLVLCLELGDRRNAGAMYSNLGERARLQGDHSSAIELYQKALDVAREMGDRPSEMIYLSNLGGARFGLGQFQEAETDLRKAIAITGMGKSCFLSETFGFLAGACLAQAKLSEALAAAQQAVAVGQQTENLLDLAGSWRVLGQVFAAMTQSGAFEARCLPPGYPLPFRDAASCFSESLRLYEMIGAEDEQARTFQIWADFDQQQGQSEEALRKRSLSQRILGRLADPPGSKKVEEVPAAFSALGNPASPPERIARPLRL